MLEQDSQAGEQAALGEQRMRTPSSPQHLSEMQAESNGAIYHLKAEVKWSSGSCFML